MEDELREAGRDTRAIAYGLGVESVIREALATEKALRLIWSGWESAMPNFGRAPEGQHYKSVLRADGKVDVYLVTE